MRRRNRVYVKHFRSMCRDIIVRGSAKQISERYIVLSEEALASGDRVLCQVYLNHAEHWKKESME